MPFPTSTNNVKAVVLRAVRKNENRFGFHFKKNRTIQKFDIRLDNVLTETACNLQFKLKVKKITLLAFNLQIEHFLKHYAKLTI